MNQLIFNYLNNFAGKSDYFDSIIIFCAHYFQYFLALGFLLLLIFSKKDKISKINFLIFAVLSVFVSRVIITEIIRYFYYIPRPFVNNAIYQLIVHSESGSFPSGHAVFFFTLATTIFFFHKKWSVLFFFGAILMGLGRVIAGLHWPIDILIGAVIGIFSTLILKYINKWN